MALFIRVFFIAGTLCTALFERILSILTLRNLQKERSGDRRAELPPVFTDEKLDTAEAYSAMYNRFSLVSSLYQITLSFAFIFTGLFGWSVSISTRFTDSPALNGYLLVLIILTGDSILNIPFSLYKTFRIEAAYGFNRQTVKGWIKDFILGILVGSILQALILIPLFFTVHRYASWWIPAFIITAVIEMLLMYIYPVIIAPLFNTFTPLENKSLEQKLKDVCSEAGIRVKGIFKMDGSRRSSHSNAYFTGVGNSRRIVLYDTLLETMSEGEIVAVFAHESGHWMKKHILKGLMLSLLLTFAGFFLISLMIHVKPLYEGFMVEYSSVSLYAGFLIILQLIGIITFPLKPAVSWLQRRFEYEADEAACDLSSGDDLGSALIKLTGENLGNPFPHPLDVVWNYSHPPLLQRLSRLT